MENVHTDGFSLKVSGRSCGTSEWHIDAALRLSGQTDAARRDRALRAGKRTLLGEVVRESARGRAYGAPSARIRVDIDGEIREISLGELIDDVVATC
jgi:hypothetical protein